MKTIELEVNGRPVTATVAPRTHLADFLREELLLTGTHLGCEHGVCGACTVMLDGAPARSCLTFAVACEGRRVRTVEGFDDDPLMGELRQAFTGEHALQCGYCTPGMLATAHDIVTRLPEADETRVREELAGNLCRCTGYGGIVRAVRRVLAARAAPEGLAPKREDGRAGVVVSGPPPPAAAAPREVAVPDGATRIDQDFTLPFPSDQVWAVFGDPAAVARALPGAELAEATPDGRLRGIITVALGPIRAGFAGEAVHRRDEANLAGTIRGEGGDRWTGSRVSGVIEYRLHAVAAETRVEVSLVFSLTGPLAQFTRSGLVADLAGRLTASFARNLEDRLAGRSGTVPDGAVDAGGLLASVIWARIKRFLGFDG